MRWVPYTQLESETDQNINLPTSVLQIRTRLTRRVSVLPKDVELVSGGVGHDLGLTARSNLKGPT